MLEALVAPAAAPVPSASACSKSEGLPMLAITAFTSSSVIQVAPFLRRSEKSSAIRPSMSLMISSRPSSFAKYFRRLSMYCCNIS